MLSFSVHKAAGNPDYSWKEDEYQYMWCSVLFVCSRFHFLPVWIQLSVYKNTKEARLLIYCSCVISHSLFRGGCFEDSWTGTSWLFQIRMECVSLYFLPEFSSSITMDHYNMIWYASLMAAQFGLDFHSLPVHYFHILQIWLPSDIGGYHWYSLPVDQSYFLLCCSSATPQSLEVNILLFKEYSQTSSAAKADYWYTCHLLQVVQGKTKFPKCLWNHVHCHVQNDEVMCDGSWCETSCHLKFYNLHLTF